MKRLTFSLLALATAAAFFAPAGYAFAGFYYVSDALGSTGNAGINVTVPYGAQRTLWWCLNDADGTKIWDHWPSSYTDPSVTAYGYGNDCGRYDTPPMYDAKTWYLWGQDNQVFGYALLYGGQVTITPDLPTCAQPWDSGGYLLYPGQTCAVYPPQGRYRLTNSSSLYLFVPRNTSAEFSTFASYAPGVTTTGY